MCISAHNWRTRKREDYLREGRGGERVGERQREADSSCEPIYVDEDVITKLIVLQAKHNKFIAGWRWSDWLGCRVHG